MPLSLLPDEVREFRILTQFLNEVAGHFFLRNIQITSLDDELVVQFLHYLVILAHVLEQFSILAFGDFNSKQFSC